MSRDLAAVGDGHETADDEAAKESARGVGELFERTETRQKRTLDKVMDTKPSTTHGCDILSELKAVGLAGSVSIAQPIAENKQESRGRRIVAPSCFHGCEAKESMCSIRCDAESC